PARRAQPARRPATRRGPGRAVHHARPGHRPTLQRRDHGAQPGPGGRARPGRRRHPAPAGPVHAGAARGIPRSRTALRHDQRPRRCTMTAVEPQLPTDDAVEVGTTATRAVAGRSRIPWRFIGGRAAFYLFTLWAALTINFFLPRMMKGDAVTQYLARNRNVSPEAADALRALLGMDTDKTLFQQYLDYWGLLLHGDLGVSLLHGLRPVTEVIGQALPWTVGLVGLATVISFAIGTIGGAFIGWRRGSKLDVFIPITTFLSTIPYFWLGLLSIAVFSVNLGWFPIGKAYGVGTVPGW